MIWPMVQGPDARDEWQRLLAAEKRLQYRTGEIKLNPWRDGFYNLWFLVKKRFT